MHFNILITARFIIGKYIIFVYGRNYSKFPFSKYLINTERRIIFKPCIAFACIIFYYVIILFFSKIKYHDYKSRRKLEYEPLFILLVYFLSIPLSTGDISTLVIGKFHKPPWISPKSWTRPNVIENKLIDALAYFPLH